MIAIQFKFSDTGWKKDITSIVKKLIPVYGNSYKDKGFLVDIPYSYNWEDENKGFMRIQLLRTSSDGELKNIKYIDGWNTIHLSNLEYVRLIFLEKEIKNDINFDNNVNDIITDVTGIERLEISKNRLNIESEDNVLDNVVLDILPFICKVSFIDKDIYKYSKELSELSFEQVRNLKTDRLYIESKKVFLKQIKAFNTYFRTFIDSSINPRTLYDYAIENIYPPVPDKSRSSFELKNLRRIITNYICSYIPIFIISDTWIRTGCFEVFYNILIQNLNNLSDSVNNKVTNFDIKTSAKMNPFITINGLYSRDDKVLMVNSYFLQRTGNKVDVIGFVNTLV